MPIQARCVRIVRKLDGPAKIVGVVVTVIAFIYVGYHAYATIALSPSNLLSATNALRVVVSAAVYALSLTLVAAAWVLLLNGLSDVHLSTTNAFKIYAVTQILKYLPSNVMHAVGRYAVTRRQGLRRSTIALSMIIENLIMAAAAIAVGSFMSELWYEEIVSNAGLFYTLLPYLIIGASLLAIFIASSLSVGNSFILRAAVSYILLLVFFVLSGSICLYILYGSGALEDIDRVAVIVGAIALAWFAGWITPGAPSGLGVREAAIIMLVGNEVGVNDASFLAIAYRLATIGGDVLFATVGLVGTGARLLRYKANTQTRL